MNTRTAITTAALALAGIGLWSHAGSRLRGAEAFEYQPNPLGLKRSPYGQVLAMAIQAPIDADWHGGIEVHDLPIPAAEPEQAHVHGPECDHDHHHGPDCDAGCGEHDPADAAELAGHGHDCGDPDCSSHHGAVAPSGPLLNRLEFAVTARTNPNPPSPGHRLYLRRAIENKLRFAYELDPSHYANYNAYNLFLTHDQLGTSGEGFEQGSKRAIRLAESTIHYCLAEQQDPRPALTAASAAYNILELMISRPGKADTGAMRHQLSVLDFCIQRHFEILDSATHNGLWEQLSPLRQQELLQRSQFTLKLRDSAEKAITRIEKDARSTASHEPS